MGLIQRIRTSIPGSTEFYEESLKRWKSRGTQSHVHALLDAGVPINLDIGAGDTRRAGWVTLDITDGCDLYWDLRRGILFPDNSVQRVCTRRISSSTWITARGRAFLGTFVECWCLEVKCRCVCRTRVSTSTHTSGFPNWTSVMISGYPPFPAEMEFPW